jgi:hypothetical protein
MMRGEPARFRPWANRERFDTLREASRRGRLIPLPELLSKSPQEFLKSGTGKLLVYYAQLWALTQFLNEGEGGRYQAALQQVLRDAADGRLRAALHAAAGSDRQQRGSTRAGPTLVLAYFNRDLDEFEAQYNAFIAAIVDPKVASRVRSGQSPLSARN